MMNHTTIAAISTAQANAGISVIRLSGEEAIEIAQKVFRSKTGRELSQMKGYTCALGMAYANGKPIDECIATVFRAPHSYTGEDVVELSCHGGIIVSRDILRALLDAGAQPAQAGEFTKRAFLNGKMDLIEAESVMNIISAGSSQEADAALRIKEGYLSAQINVTKSELTNIAAHLNAWADYPEEDIPEVDPKYIGKKLNIEVQKLLNILSRYDNGKIISDGIDTVIVGKPNVGKSTLMNKLAGLERSIVTSVPGTTRDIIEEQVMVGNYKLNLIDTAGIHDTEDEVEKIGVERAQKKLQRAQLIFFVVDASRPLDQDDYQIYDSLPKNVPIIEIHNKSDLCDHFRGDEIWNELQQHSQVIKDRIYSFNCSLKQKLFDLKTFEMILSRKLFGEIGGYAEQIISYNERQRSLTKKAINCMKDAIEALDMGLTLDAVTVSTEEAIGCLCELTGERVTDEVVDQVFHRFCVGK